MEEFRNQLLKYLFVEKRLDEIDAEKQKQMSIEKKVEQNLLLVGVTVSEQDGETYVLNVPDNYSKLRAGDMVQVTEEGTRTQYGATVIDVFFDTITITCDKQLDATATYALEQKAPALLQSLISCLEGIYSGVPGAGFLRLLSGEEPFEIDDFMKVSVDEIPNFDSVKDKLNEEQLSAVSSMLEYPPIHVLQGPPGTGKTLVLAATAIATAHMNREVVIIANTHQAVNNALQKIGSLDKKVTLIKVGAKLKADELDDSVLKFEKFSDYYEYSYKNRKKKRTGHIIGMTIWGAVAHLGLRHHSHFRPYQALVDEASLMPLSIATILGKTAPSVCLFGDSRQMPPIFRSELEDNKFSISILDYCAERVEGVPVSVLHTTYRMNQEITELVSKNYYEPFGEKLISSDFSKDRRLKLNAQGEDKMINEMLSSEQSVWEIEPPMSHPCEDMNEEEAEYISRIIKTAVESGMSTNDMAVITPYRRQVKTIREYLHKDEYLGSNTTLPLVDTVERLQGQDVDLIIISTCATDQEYFSAHKEFLTNPNRLNVMFSRAKKKVIFLRKEQLWAI
ncbi:MAG: AAA domain-containing protein [Bacteroidaceae bacterium]|nr:AAA domain-containing protein [Bacteroidaceae bacterium]